MTESTRSQRARFEEKIKKMDLHLAEHLKNINKKVEEKT